MRRSEVVNAFTEWGELETVVVGNADPKSCYDDPCVEWDHDELSEWMNYPSYQQMNSRVIKEAQWQLDNLAEILRGEKIGVTSCRAVDSELRREMEKRRSTVLQEPTSEKDDMRVVTKRGASTWRAEARDWTEQVHAPGWTAGQFCSTCPRDTMITLGNDILAATMSDRGRYFEYLAFHRYALSLWRADPRGVRYIHAPKPSMADDMFDPSFKNLTEDEIWNRIPRYQYQVNELEPIFDAADMMKFGRDVIIRNSVVTNLLGAQWLSTHFPQFRFHHMHFPTDTCPVHIDTTFVPLRPPTAGSPGLILINPDWPPLESESRMFWDNDWEFIVAPRPATDDTPMLSLCSSWLSVNMLSVSPKCVVLEENEIATYNLLNDYGFDVVTVPMRYVAQFGGGIHCATWDIKRNDDCKDYFPTLGDDFEQPHMLPGYKPGLDIIDVRMNYENKVRNCPGERWVGSTVAWMADRQWPPQAPAPTSQ